MILMRIKILVVMLLWASCFPLLRLGINDAPHMTFAAMRALLAGLALIMVAYCLKRPIPKGFRNWLSLLGIGLGATSLGFWGMFHASEFVAPGIATVMANTQPILAAVVGYYVLNEKLQTPGKMGILLAFIGIIFIAAPELLAQSDHFSLGLFYIFMATLGVTVSNILIRLKANQLDVFWAMGFQLILGSIPLIGLAAFQPQPFHIYWSIAFLLSLLSLSLLGTAVAYLLWFNVLATIELNYANVYTFLVPVFGVLMGAIFYQETFGAYAIIGILLAILGVILVNVSGRKTLGSNPNSH